MLFKLLKWFVGAVLLAMLTSTVLILLNGLIWGP